MTSPIEKTDRLIGILAATLALVGGGVLIVLIVMTTLSITGRALVPLGLSPVPGDFELVETATAFAVFAFLPWCQYTRGHAAVEFVTNGLPYRIRHALEILTEALLLGLACLILWRHLLGTLDMRQYGETTLILQFPVWWAYAASSVAIAVMVIVAAWCLFRSIAYPALGITTSRIDQIT